MIDPNSLRIISNYVLVKPDPYHDEYNCGILTSSYRYDEKGQKHSTEMEHVSVSGVVYAVCERLDFRGHDIWHVQDNSSMRRGTMVRVPEAQKRIDEHRKYSVGYDVEIEVKRGDRVFFDYFAHMNADAEGLWQDTAEGKMMLIKYDMLILSQRGEEIIPLNGYILIENESIDKQEIEPGISGTITDSGIVLVTDQTDKKTRTTAEAKVISNGCRCKAYLDNRDKGDATGFFHYLGDHKWQWQHGDVSRGTKIIYDPRYAKEVEYPLHRIFSDKRLLRIQRKDVYCIVDEKTPVISYI